MPFGSVDIHQWSGPEGYLWHIIVDGVISGITSDPDLIGDWCSFGGFERVIDGGTGELISGRLDN